MADPGSAAIPAPGAPPAATLAAGETNGVSRGVAATANATPAGASAAATASAATAAGGSLSLTALTALVVGSMIGGGIFSLPQAFARSSGVFGAVVAWAIAGTGMLTLALVFQTLSRRRPDLDAGIYAYAEAGFGAYAGFLSALGYWASACLGNVSFLVLGVSTLGSVAPMLGEGDTPAGALLASAILWGFHFMLLRGVKEAAAINTIVTVAKVVPILVFLVVAGAALRSDLLHVNLWGGVAPSWPALLEQVRGTLLITVFVFIGIEGASVYSRYASRRRDVGLATVLGFAGVLALLTLVTLLPYGILSRAEIAGLHNPSMAGILGAILGPWGSAFVGVGVLVSVLGAFLSWSLLAAEVLSTAARQGTMPRFLAGENANGAPAAALWLTNGAVQVFLLVTLLGESALRLAMELTSGMSLVPYLLVAAFSLQLAWRGETYAGDPRARRVDLALAGVATLYAAFLILFGGPKYVLLSAILYAPGTLLYLRARRERRLRAFTRMECALLVIVCLAAVGAALALASGALPL